MYHTEKMKMLEDQIKFLNKQVLELKDEVKGFNQLIAADDTLRELIVNHMKMGETCPHKRC